MIASVAPRPWHRETMVWLVIALPAAVVVAGIATLAIAVRSGNTDAMPAAVQRTAQVQVADLSADRRAAEADLRAELHIDADTGALRLTTSTAIPAGARLRLSFVHPTRARDDLASTLVASENGWLGRADAPRDHDWLLELRPADGAWRLVGRLPATATHIQLQPALAGDE